MTESLRVFASDLIDYAGLFPPSKLPMDDAVANYARYRASEDAWMLGRFIAPAARLGDFETAALPHLPDLEDIAGSGDRGGPGESPWAVSAVVSLDRLDEDVERIFELNRRHSRPLGDDADDETDGGAARLVVDAVELHVPDARAVDRALEIIPEQLDPFFEVPLGEPDRVRGIVTALAGTGAKAKIRCGGVERGLFPPIDAVAGFLVDAAAAGVAFKATAGLHHPLRGEFNMTYDPDPPRCVMHGFVNVFAAAALAREAQADRAALERVLAETDPRAITLGKDGLAWEELEVSVSKLARVRESFALSFGSCSFTEPTAELRELGWL